VFAVGAFRLAPSAGRVLVGLQVLRSSLPALEVLHRELQLESPGPLSDGAAAPAVFQRDIRLVDLTFVYPNATAHALSGVCIQVNQGECVGLIGPTGAGKTTLVDTILGLLTPTAGAVLVDGVDIQRHLRSWQNQIGYVPQFIFLTDDTLRRNVAFGLADGQIDDGAVQRAIRAARLEEFVAGLPAGLETVVGENGVRLSGGQRQRVGIARALYHDPAVLVLDEATSALDGQTEQAVMEAVSALHGRKTVLIVAHRHSTVARCDRLYEIDRGRAVAEIVPRQPFSPARVGRP
jgi:ABC-type multidrug transport system fused ATPase/permease subunit